MGKKLVELKKRKKKKHSSGSDVSIPWEKVTDPTVHRKNILKSLNPMLRGKSTWDFFAFASMKFGPMENSIKLPRIF